MTEQITKENIEMVLSGLLRSKNIEFDISNMVYGISYTLYLKTDEVGIYIDTRNSFLEIKFYVPIRKLLNVLTTASLYESKWRSDSGTVETLENEIELLTKFVDNFNSTVSTIQNKINEIKEVCKRENLDDKLFIKIAWDFNS